MHAVTSRSWEGALGLGLALTLVGACTKPVGGGDDDPADGGDSAVGSLTAMASSSGGGAESSTGSDELTSTSAAATTTGDTASDDTVGPPSIKLDVGAMPDGGGAGCAAPPQVHCDQADDDPWHALSLNCPGGPQVDGTIDLTGPEQIHVHQGNVGTFMPPPFPPREGNKVVILSSGAAADLLTPGLFASTGIDFLGSPLPPPIQTNNVSPTDDCVDNPALVGTGDCSNTINDQWVQGFGGSYDYAEMRFSTTVPAGTPGFTYDFAMFSTEYPNYYQTQYNDMYIAWLESELWTGNISFDDMGHPISLNAGFLDYKDAPNMYDCPAPCVAPELQGTAMEGHAGTRWLTTTAGVTPGEDIEVIFAIFDLSDSVLDTVMLLDNFQWACEGGGPVTIPG